MNKTMKMKLLLGSAMALTFVSAGHVVAAGWFDSPDELTVMQEKLTADKGSGYSKTLRKFEITQNQINAAKDNKRKIKNILNRLKGRASGQDKNGIREGSIPTFLANNENKLMADEEETANDYIKEIDRVRGHWTKALDEMD